MRACLLSILLAAVFPPLSHAQTPLEFHYEFDSADGPVVDSAGKANNMGLATNGEPHRLGEGSLIGDDGFSIGLDAPGVDHPTGSYMTVGNAPHPESFSVSLWIRPLFTGTNQAIFARDNVWWPSPCNFYCLYIDQFQSLVWKTGGEEQILTDEGTLEEDEVYHLVVTHADIDGADSGAAERSRIYVNGELLDEVRDPTEVPSLDSIADANGIYQLFWLGTLSSFGGYLGEMDDVQFYSAELTGDQVAAMYANPGSLANFGGASGDFDTDGELDIDDINLLVQETASGANALAFDLNGDAQVDTADIQSWVELKNTWIGDSDLDGEFNSTDFVVVFAGGEYEDDVAGNSVWSDGDWNGDGDFTSADFVIAFASGGYEAGPRAAVVPEPCGLLNIFIAASLLGSLRLRGSGSC